MSDGPVSGVPPAPRLTNLETLVAVALAALAALGTGIWAAAAPALHEAEVTLVARASRLGDEPAPPVQAAMFTPLVANLETADHVVSALDLATRSPAYTPGRFLRDALRVNVVGGAPLIVVRVRLPDRDLAARAANEVAAAAVAQSRRLGQHEAGEARDRLRDLHAEARRRYDEAQEALEAFRRKSHVDFLRRDAEALLGERGGALKLSIDLASERARLARIEQEAAARPRIDTLTRSIDSDPALMAAAQGATGGSALELTLTDEQISAAHEAIDAERARTRALVAALDERLAALRRSGVNAAQSKTLSALYAAERQLADHELDVAIARRTYELAATQYENARLQVATRSTALDVLAAAHPPEQPLSRRVVLQSGLAFGLVFGTVLLGLYARQLLARSR